MLEKRRLPIQLVYVPTKRRKTLEIDRVLTVAEDILDRGQLTPIRVRADGDRFVLIEGLHRLEALRSLGEDNVDAFVVSARLH